MECNVGTRNYLAGTTGDTVPCTEMDTGRNMTLTPAKPSGGNKEASQGNKEASQVNKEAKAIRSKLGQQASQGNKQARQGNKPASQGNKEASQDIVHFDNFRHGAARTKVRI